MAGKGGISTGLAYNAYSPVLSPLSDTSTIGYIIIMETREHEGKGALTAKAKNAVVKTYWIFAAAAFWGASMNIMKMA